MLLSLYVYVCGLCDVVLFVVVRVETFFLFLPKMDDPKEVRTLKITSGF